MISIIKPAYRYANIHETLGVINTITLDKNISVQKSLLYFYVRPMITSSIINNKNIKSTDHSPHHD